MYNNVERMRPHSYQLFSGKIMLDIQQLRKDLPSVVAGLARRGVAFDEAAFRTLEDSRKVLQTKTEDLNTN
jgi:hypothetical protein